MDQKIILSVMLALMLVGCGQGDTAVSLSPLPSAVAADVPAFLEVGRTYEMQVGAGLKIMKLMEIDKNTGWIKASQSGKELWVNLNQVITIRDASQ